MYKISSTSGLVLHLTDRSLYQSPAAQKYWDNLDIEDSRDFTEGHRRIWPNCYEEVNNRKFGIKKFCNEFLTNTPDCQVVFLGAGLDPKSVDLAENYPNARVFDVDMDNMDIKKQITKNIDGPQNLKFCTADICNQDQLLTALKAQGWSNDRTTLMVAEGLTYYVPKESLKQAFRALRSPGDALILEYSLPQNDIVIPPGERHPSQEAFDYIQDKTKMEKPMERYSISDVEVLASDLQASRLITLGQKKLELERTGHNKIYSDQYSGALCISYIQFA